MVRGCTDGFYVCVPRPAKHADKRVYYLNLRTLNQLHSGIVVELERNLDLIWRINECIDRLAVCGNILSDPFVTGTIDRDKMSIKWDSLLLSPIKATLLSTIRTMY